MQSLTDRLLTRLAIANDLVTRQRQREKEDIDSALAVLRSSWDCDCGSLMRKLLRLLHEDDDGHIGSALLWALTGVAELNASQTSDAKCAEAIRDVSAALQSDPNCTRKAVRMAVKTMKVALAVRRDSSAVLQTEMVEALALLTAPSPSLLPSRPTSASSGALADGANSGTAATMASIPSAIAVPPSPPMLRLPTEKQPPSPTLPQRPPPVELPPSPSWPSKAWRFGPEPPRPPSVRNHLSVSRMPPALKWRVGRPAPEEVLGLSPGCSPVVNMRRGAAWEAKTISKSDRKGGSGYGRSSGHYLTRGLGSLACKSPSKPHGGEALLPSARRHLAAQPPHCAGGAVVLDFASRRQRPIVD